MTKQPKQMLTVKQAAKMLTLSPQTLNNWRCLGRGPKFEKFGKRVAYDPDVIESYRQKHRFMSSQQAKR